MRLKFFRSGWTCDFILYIKYCYLIFVIVLSLYAIKLISAYQAGGTVILKMTVVIKVMSLKTVHLSIAVQDNSSAIMGTVFNLIKYVTEFLSAETNQMNKIVVCCVALLMSICKSLWTGLALLRLKDCTRFCMST